MKTPAQYGLIQPNTAQRICSQHGAFQSMNYLRDIWTQCPKCMELARQQEAIAAEKARQQQRIANQMKKLADACLPRRFASRTFDHFIAHTARQQHVLQIAKSYAEHFIGDALQSGKNLIFCGKKGTGKTHLAASIALYIMQHHDCPVLFSNARDAIRRIRETWQIRNDKSGDSESEIIRLFTVPDLLILDEIGVQFGNNTEKVILFDIMNARYEQYKPSLIISNHNLDKIEAFVGERIIDRLCEHSEVIVFDWESYRWKP